MVAKKMNTGKAARNNPLLGRWYTPFGVPPFERIEVSHFPPAFKTAISQHKAELRTIAGLTTKPTFANTLVALERSGALLERVADVFFNLASADTNAELQEIERDMAPMLADHMSAMFLNAKLFKRIDDLYSRRGGLKLDAEQARLLERIHKVFARAGAQLRGQPKKRVAEINARLAVLATQFSQNVLADEQSWRLVLREEADLAGLPDTVRAAAKRTAESLGLNGVHAITLARSSVEPFLQFSSRRDLREEAFKAWTLRGENGGKTDNRSIISEIVALRAEFARLMGYESYAAFRLEDTMAKTPAAVRDLLGRVWPAGVSRAAKERDALAALVRADGGNYKVAAWDWRYLSEKERKARYDLDEAEVRSYLVLDNVLAAAFDTASRLFSLVFEERHDVPRYHPDVRTWEVRTKSGKHIGLFMGDYFARPSKRSGAWMSTFRGQHKLKGEVRPIVTNVMSCAKGGEGEPTLLSFDDARTLFHELGHGLHGLLSDVTYPSLACTNVSLDFVELPSQLFEHWLSRPEVLSRFALHYKTGKPMPKKLLSRLEAARTFNQGFQTVEYAASALLDMELHALEDARGLDVSAFEAEVLGRIGMPAEIVPRHRIPHFQHITGGYGAGYYSYLWSEVMDADAFDAFVEAGDIYDRGTARKLKKHVYSAGNRRDPADAYVAFRGRPPEIDSLLKKRGLVS
jgi:peptidyl-dipeptidase Dcp